MKNKKKIFTKIFIAVIVIAAVVIFFYYNGTKKNVNLSKISISGMVKYLKSYGNKSILIYILIYALKPFVVIIPASVISIASVMVFGSFYGTIYTMIGAGLGATTGFYLARFLGKDFVDKISKGKVNKINLNLEENGFRIILLMRLAVIFNYDILSYVAGLSKMKYKDFLLGTLLGILPEMFAYNYLGTNLNGPFTYKTAIIIIIVLLLALIPNLIKKKRSK